jgi:hypothetical protein
LSRRCSASGTLRIWIIVMRTTQTHAPRMSHSQTRIPIFTGRSSIFPAFSSVLSRL